VPFLRFSTSYQSKQPKNKQNKQRDFSKNPYILTFPMSGVSIMKEKVFKAKIKG
jgi:hypothetical protein